MQHQQSANKARYTINRFKVEFCLTRWQRRTSTAVMDGRERGLLMVSEKTRSILVGTIAYSHSVLRLFFHPLSRSINRILNLHMCSMNVIYNKSYQFQPIFHLSGSFRFTCQIFTFLLKLMSLISCVYNSFIVIIQSVGIFRSRLVHNSVPQDRRPPRWCRHFGWGALQHRRRCSTPSSCPASGHRSSCWKRFGVV